MVNLRATRPSGTELPDWTEAEFINEFKLTTEFNNVAVTDTAIVKTSLIYVKDQGWKVDDVEFIGQLTGREE